MEHPILVSYEWHKRNDITGKSCAIFNAPNGNMTISYLDRLIEQIKNDNQYREVVIYAITRLDPE